jgi:hypothetical protein
MTLRSEDPPPPGNITVATPPVADRPTTAMLKADIDSGRTGDKVAHYDPGLSQLGTDDEAAGNPPSHDRVALARATEAASPRVREAAKPQGRNAWVLPLFTGAIVLIPVVIGALLFVLDR